MWQLNAITEDEIMMECGMDSVCIIRLLLMGYKLCLLAAFNAIWLMPLYSTASSDSNITDPVVSVTITKVSNGSPRLIGTVLATYFLFGYLMYLVLKEFEWFIEIRHKHLKRPVVENYAVYVRNIPPEYCSNEALYNYFAGCFTNEKVLEAKVRIKLPSLTNAVNKRKALVKRLEHAINYQTVKNKVPKHDEIQILTLKREKVESIPFYLKALRDLNVDISNRIEAVEMTILVGTHAEHPSDDVIESACTLDSDQMSAIKNPAKSTRSVAFANKVDISTHSLLSSKSSASARLTANIVDDTMQVDILDENNEVDALSGLDSTMASSVRNGLFHTSKTLSAASRAAAGKTLSMAKSATSTASKIISIRAEGEYYSAGFVTFSNLGTTHAALQMVHHQTPFHFEVLEAPRPDDIFWSNVGRSHYDLQVGKLLSLCSTTALCLLWTIPMTFIASLSSIDALSTQIPALGRLIEESPFIGKLFEVLAPLLVKVVNGLLPTILEFLTKFEGPVAGSVIVASLFTKLAAFMIIQTFFVSAVGSSLLKG
jgi:Calcium-dependent channel, 7TM region, putative phosphate/Late exocytosis, associated with Golgi transport/Cytosolic domain of 10TM putative phosphate transporter